MELVGQIRSLDKTKGKTYVEIGVEAGTTFLQIKAKKKIAIDPKFKIPFYKKLSIYNIFKSKYFEMESNEFFLIIIICLIKIKLMLF